MEQLVERYAIPLTATHCGRAISAAAFSLAALRVLPLADHTALNREFSHPGRYGLVWSRTRPDDVTGLLFNTAGRVEYV